MPKSAEIYAYALNGDQYVETAVYEKESRPTPALFPDLSLDLDRLSG